MLCQLDYFLLHVVKTAFIGLGKCYNFGPGFAASTIASHGPVPEQKRTTICISAAGLHDILRHLHKQDRRPYWMEDQNSKPERPSA